MKTKPYTRFKAEMKDIWTVVILDYEQELSTASFNDFADAVEYAKEEIFNNEELDRSSDEGYIQETLDKDMFYRGGNATYWIEEAYLVS